MTTEDQDDEICTGRDPRSPALKTEEGATGQGMWAPPEAGKGKEAGSPLEPPEGAQPRRHLGFSSVRPCLISEV